MPEPSRSPRHVLLALVLLCALALGVRLHGNDYLLPHQPEPDAVIVWQAAWWDRPAEVERMTAFAYEASFYPHLLGRLLAALPGPAYPVVEPPGAPLAEHLDAAGLRYRRGRTLITLISVLAIPALYLIARRFLAPGWALLAAAFLATSLLNHSYSQQARPHTASIAVCLLALLAALRLRAAPSRTRYLVAALAAFLALGVLHNGVFVLPAMLLAHLWAPRRDWPAFGASALVVLAALPVFYPFYIEAGIAGIFRDDGVDLGGQALRRDLFSGAGYLKILRSLWGWEPVITLLAGAGLLAGLRALARGRPDADRLREIALVASFPLAFAGVWGLWTVVPARFVNGLVPFVALLAACGARAVLRALVPAGAPARAAVLVAGALALLALPAFVCFKLARLRGADDTHERAADWLVAHVDRERDVIATEILLYLPLPMERAGIEAVPAWSHHAWDFYQLAFLDAHGDGGDRYRVRALFRPEFYADRVIDEPEIEGVLREERPEWVVVSAPTQETVTTRMRTRDAVRKLYGEPVARFLPFDVEGEALPGSGYELSYEGFRRVLVSDTWGTPIEVYRRADAGAEAGPAR